MSVNERIKQLRKMLELSQEQFSTKIGYKSRGKITNIESEKTVPDREFIDLLCRIFPVNRNWLENGIGNPLLPDEDPNAIYASELLEDTENPLYDLIKGIMKTYLELEENDKKVFKKFAKELSQNLKKDGD